MNPILPGATIGVLGSGQLGRMFTIAARRMGYRVHTLSPDEDTPTGQVADTEIQASYDDLDAVRAFASGVDVVTFEFENVPAATAAAAESRAPVRPSGEVLHITQHRLREKQWLAANGFPVAPFAAVTSPDELRTAVARIGAPAILKSAGFGYDGKGQIAIGSTEDLNRAWQQMAQDAVLEHRIDFECELSVVAARGESGEFVDYGTVRNRHVNGILDVTSAPSCVPPDIQKEAVRIAREVLDQLHVIGVLCVEFFLTRSGKLLVNELAPRPHNSGHFTIDACVTSQFEQQLRAVCGLPLGDVTMLRPAAMTNLLGDLWADGDPNWPAALAIPDAKLHLYGKSEPRPGRKMGHITAIAANVNEAERRAFHREGGADEMTAITLTILLASLTEVRVVQNPTSVVVTIDNQPASTFMYGESVTKPYLWPLRTAAGVEVTRHWPMQDVEGDPHDHPHHRGAWFAHSQVNGFDFWNSDPSYRMKNMGHIVVDRIVKLTSAAHTGSIYADLSWHDPGGKELIDETRVMTFTDGSPREIDFDITLTARTDIVFGDDKDGVFGIRLAHELQEPAGKMTASSGCHQEKECWGTRADWLDVSGTIEGRAVGITVFDDPANPRHPTYWHARGYGLLGANIFGVKAFSRDTTADGSMQLKSGKSLRFRYRVVLHDGPFDPKALR